MTDLFDANVVLVQATLVNFLLALSLLVPVRAGVFTFSGIGAYGIGTYATAATSLHWGWDATAAIGPGSRSPVWPAARSASSYGGSTGCTWAWRRSRST
ncbi:hypothetical protein BJF78_00450 [Pseudonocardia sp. CNS-139]|nr:hypothetical protein BJF78_00450 [Pseudonocardia sp. CNS-139]